MAVQSMNLLNVTFKKENVLDILLRINNAPYFYLQKASMFIHSQKNVKVLETDSSYDNLYHRLQQTSFRLGFELEDIHYHNEQLDIEKANQYLDEIEEKLNKIEAVKKELQQVKDENVNTLAILEKIEGDELNLDQLFKCHYLKCRIGQVPKKNIPKLDYYEGYPFIFKVFKEDNFYVWCAYYALSKDIMEIDNIFSSLMFKSLRIPDFVHGTVSEGLNELKEEISAMNEYIQTMDQRINILKEEHRLQLNQLYTKVTHLTKIYSLSPYVLDYTYLASIYGFVSDNDLEKIKALLNEVNDVEITVLPADTYMEVNVMPPVILNNSRFFKPFEILSSAKHYGDYDTTYLVSLLWLGVSGIFFGDIALGLVLLILGLIFSKKSNFFKIVRNLGISSLVFGILYGSIAFKTTTMSLITLPLSLSQKVMYGCLTIVLGQWVLNCVNAMFKNKKNNRFVDLILGVKGISGLFILTVLVVYAIVKIQFGKDILNLPLELIVIVIMLLTLFKNKLFLNNK